MPATLQICVEKEIIQIKDVHIAENGEARDVSISYDGISRDLTIAIFSQGGEKCYKAFSLSKGHLFKIPKDVADETGISALAKF